jgi:hypothetical protein
MQIFIDESGSFTGYDTNSIDVVAALAIPDSSLKGLRRKYKRIRSSLPQENGEVKGKLLAAKDVNRIVGLLANRHAIFEVTAIDLSLHTEAGVIAYRQKLARETRESLGNIPRPLRDEVEAAVDFLDQLTPQLFIQALTTFELVHRTISNSIPFFAQRRPYELASFSWIVDGKDSAKVTSWENWLSFYAPGALIALSKRSPVPMPQPEGPYLFNYSFLDRFRRKENPENDSLDPARLLQDFNFRSGIEMGLEFVDILANATRRMLRGALEREGWISMHRLIIHRNETYIKFILYGPGPDVVQTASYGAVVNEGFTKGGRSMFTRRNEGYEKAS